MISGTKLREYRKPRKVSQAELAIALGYADKSHVCRMERRNITPVEFTEAIAAVEKVVASRMATITPADAAVEGAA